MTLCRCESCWSSSWRSRDNSSGSHNSCASMISSNALAEGAVDRGVVVLAARLGPGRPGRPGSSSLDPGIISPSPASAASCASSASPSAGEPSSEGWAPVVAPSPSFWFSPSASSPSCCSSLSDESVDLAEIEVEILEHAAGHAAHSRPGLISRGRARPGRGRCAARATAATDRRPCARQAAAARGSTPRGSAAAPPRPSCSRCAR